MPQAFKPTLFSTLFLSALCLASPAVLAGDDKAPDLAFTAFGVQKISWRAVVADGKLLLEGEKIAERTIAVDSLPFAKGVEFSGRDGKLPVNLSIRSQACRDPQGNVHEFTATLRHGKKTLKGCAVAGAIAHAPT